MQAREARQGSRRADTVASRASSVSSQFAAGNTMSLFASLLDERYPGGLLDEYESAAQRAASRAAATGRDPAVSAESGPDLDGLNVHGPRFAGPGHEGPNSDGLDKDPPDLDHPKRRGRHVVLLVVGVVVLGILLTVTAVQTRESAPAAAAERQSLVERVESASARTNALRSDIDTVRSELSTRQSAALAASAAGMEVQRSLDTLGAASGADAVSGPGVRVIVDDAPVTDDTVAAPTEGRVLDIDLQELVNGLWAAGAEAISVDNQRVTSLSSIRMAGDAVFMDLQPLSRPYAIAAVGDPDSLPAKFVDSYGGAWMQTLAGTYGIRFDVTRADHLVLPGASSLTLSVAQPVAPTPQPEPAASAGRMP